MPYKLSGVLKSPNGQPLTGVDIQFIAQQTQSPVLQQTDHNIRLGLDGAYNVTLENNTYSVKAQINGLGPQHMGYILISSDTPAGLDLPQLLRSYSQQSTAPDYAQLIEKWLAEAKAAADTSTAQAASAKSQADRAKSEADRASQISGLDTVADAIWLAAVPFPDVWIPFNDSLRMFAGYGREVKVGDDVVARMVNYERNGTATFWDKSGVFRTAAINEPRFEKPGLLIEGQSTNLLPYSDDASKFIPVNCSADSSGVVTGSSPGGTQTRIEYRGVVPVGSTGYTCSVEYDPSQGLGVIQVRLGGSESGFPVASTDIVIDDANKKVVRKVMPDGWVRVSVTSKVAAGEDLVRINFAPHGSGNSVDVTSGLKAKVRRMQLEPLPFASSHIPTNGTAVTRAADKCWIPSELNIPQNYGDSTISMEVVRNINMPVGLFARCVHISDRQFMVADGSRVMTRGGGTEQANIGSQATGARELIAVTINGSSLSCFLNGVKSTISSSKILPVDGGGKCFVGSRNGLDGLFGHIRNLRIWHHALSDAQIKGLK